MKGKIKFFSARNISILAVLVALVIVLQLWGSMIPIGVTGINLSFVLVPITLGAIILGPVAGLILGFIFSFVVLMTGVTGFSAFTAYVLADSPFFTVVTVLLKGMVAGFVCGIVYKLISKKNKYVAVFVAAAVVPIINTGIFILGCLCMSGTIQTLFAGTEFEGHNIIYIIIVGIVTVNFFIEFAINIICAPVLNTVTEVVEKQILKKYPPKKKPEQEEVKEEV